MDHLHEHSDLLETLEKRSGIALTDNVESDRARLKRNTEPSVLGMMFPLQSKGSEATVSGGDSGVFDALFVSPGLKEV